MKIEAKASAISVAAEIKDVKFSSPPTPQELGKFLTHLRHDISSVSLSVEQLKAKHEKESRMKELTLEQNLEYLTQQTENLERTLKYDYCTRDQEILLREEMSKIVQGLKKGVADKTGLAYIKPAGLLPMRC
jgi:hypothetical protein